MASSAPVSDNIIIGESSNPGSTVSSAKAKMWAVYGDTFIACEKAIDKLEPGQYVIVNTQDRGIVFVKKTVTLDSFIHLPDSASEAILSEIETFWSREDRYRKFGFLWKRGVLLYGPPGSGKTTTVQMLSEKIINAGGLAIYVDNPKIGAYGLDLLRKIEPDRPIIVILEDLDSIIKKYEETELLSLLDGELQIDNVVFIATTNYPQKLDPRIINRPSRFDIVKKIPMPSADARRVFILSKNPDLETRTVEVVDKAAREFIENSKARLSKLTDEVLTEKVSDVKRHLKEAKKTDDYDTIKFLEDRISELESGADEAKSLRESIKNAVDPVRNMLEIDLWVEKTDGYSVAHMKELIIAVECFGRPIDEAVRRLNAMIKMKSSDSDGNIGFD